MVTSDLGQPRYERIGQGYAQTRRADPCFEQRILAALGTARTVVNVIGIEPSDVMGSAEAT